MALSNFFTLSGDAVKKLEAKDLSMLLALLVLFLTHWSYVEYTSYISFLVAGVPPGILGRLKAPYRWRRESRHMLLEGMNKYEGKPFKVRMLNRLTLTYLSLPY